MRSVGHGWGSHQVGREAEGRGVPGLTVQRERGGEGKMVGTQQ